MVRFTPCECPAAKMERVPRSGWMRLIFRSYAQYQCMRCGRRLLASPATQAQIGTRAFKENEGDSSASGADQSSPNSAFPKRGV